jgi:O-Antigen ligase
LLWAVALALILRREINVCRVEYAFVLGFAVIVAWIALSALWSEAPSESLLETERALVYAAGAAAAIFVTRARQFRHLLGSVLCGIGVISVFSLGTRLAPDRIGVFDRSAVYRLAQPIGYWNGLALFTAMGALLALGFAARARTIGVRAASAALLPILVLTFYFTFGRAAWVALGAGYIVMIAVDRHRLHAVMATLALTPAAAATVLIAAQKEGLTHGGTSLASAAHDGHRVALWLVLLALLNGIFAAALGVAERRVVVEPRVRRLFGAAIAIALIAGLAVVFARFGAPETLARKGYDAFRAPPPHVSGNLNRRLLSFSGNGRADLWRLAWDDALRHPALGAGAGMYERYFLAHQPADVGRVRDAHGLYVETFAELGPIGLGMLSIVLLMPLGVLRRARRHALIPATTGAYAAFLVHAGVDWDWELAGITYVAVILGAAILIAARRFSRPSPARVFVRWGVASAAVVAAAYAVIALGAHIALSRSQSALEDGRVANAALNARRAQAWEPWSPDPWIALGRAQVAGGQLAAARRSFRNALRHDDGNWETWYELSRASRGRARAQALKRAVELYPRLRVALHAAGKR